MVLKWREIPKKNLRISPNLTWGPRALPTLSLFSLFLEVPCAGLHLDALMDETVASPRLTSRP
jgi:hypothetical protein